MCAIFQLWKPAALLIKHTLISPSYANLLNRSESFATVSQHSRQQFVEVSMNGGKRAWRHSLGSAQWDVSNEYPGPYRYRSNLESTCPLECNARECDPNARSDFWPSFPAKSHAYSIMHHKCHFYISWHFYPPPESDIKRFLFKLLLRVFRGKQPPNRYKSRSTLKWKTNFTA